MNEIVLPKEKAAAQLPLRDDQESHQVVGGKKRPKRPWLFKLLLFLIMVSLIIMVVFGVTTRSATTENLQQEANKAFSELAVSVT